MKIPDLTTKEARRIVDDAYSVDTADPDYTIANTAFRRGVDAARDDILTAIELFQNYPDMVYVEQWQEALEEVKSYIFTHLDLNEYYLSPV